MCRRDFPYMPLFYLCAYVNKNHATAEIHPNTAQVTSLLFFFPSAHTQDGVFKTFHAKGKFRFQWLFISDTCRRFQREKNTNGRNLIFNLLSFNGFKISPWNLTTIIYIILIPALAHVFRLEAVRLKPFDFVCKNAPHIKNFMSRRFREVQ